jgi:DNA-binding response OmpR family regulator
MTIGTVVERQADDPPPIRVLIADPDESLLAGYSEFLSQDGFEVFTASSGLRCIDRLDECNPHVLVLEPQLPWGGGDGVLAMMRRVPDLAAVPVMVLTSCRDPLVLDRVAPFPISDYHVKPLAPDRLAKRIRDVLDHRQRRNFVTEQNDRLEQCIDRRTGGRVRNLHVETLDDRVIVHGCSSSFHVQQLALAAVIESVDASDAEPENVELNIQLCGGF